MEVEIISKTCIKPSSPTPSHLKTYKISLLDQLLPPVTVPMILYYPIKNNDLSSKMSMLLKESLSETLAYYYPLAGRIKNNLSVDCNDEGVCYVEAKANISLSQYLNQPDIPSMISLLPKKTNWYEPDPTTSYLMIQVTIFECGSITIGAVVSHMIMDVATLASFLKCWAAIACKSSKDMIPPNFDAPSIFPQHEPFPKDANVGSLSESFLKTGKCATRRFVFDACSIANLKTELLVTFSTRVEVLSSLLLECIANVLNEKSSSGIDRPIAFTQTINLRSRATPPILDTSFGNFLWLTSALCMPKEIKLTGLVCKVREAIAKINSDFVKNIQNGGVKKVYELIKDSGRDVTTSSENEVNFVAMTSWCNFGLYDVDFGWGKPIWVTCADLPSADYEASFVNSFILMDADTDKGIEAWVRMDEEDLTVLEKHKHLLKYASFNPSPMKYY